MPATTLVSRLLVGLSVSSAAEVVSSLAVDPGTSGVPGVRCQRTLPVAGSSTTPVNVPGNLPTGAPSAAASPVPVGRGAVAARGPSLSDGSGGCADTVGDGWSAASIDGPLSAATPPAAAAVIRTTRTVMTRRKRRPGRRNVCPIR